MSANRTMGIVAVVLYSSAALVAGQAKANPRVFVSDSQSAETAGGFAANGSTAVGGRRGGARPQTAEVVKTVGEACKQVTGTSKQENADYILVLEHEGGKGYARKDNKWALFNKDGDAVGSGSTRALGSAVKDACKALTDNWTKEHTAF